MARESLIDSTESANASNGSAGAKPVRNPEREKPKWEDTAGYLMDGDEMGFDADVMLLAMMLQEMKNEDVKPCKYSAVSPE